MNSRKFSVFSAFFISYFLVSTFVSAQAQPPADDFLGVDLTVQDISRIITGFACWLIGIVLAVMVIFLVIAGVRYFLARGNEVKVADATKNLTWTLVGILVILATNVIIATVANFLDADYSFLPLNCGPIAQVTNRISGSCRGLQDCPPGYSCFIPVTNSPRNQVVGTCIRQ